MNRLITKSIALVALVGAFTLFSSSKAEAAFTLALCDDAACSGGGDTLLTDLDGDGVIAYAGPAIGGMEVVITAALSKPTLSSGMDLSFSVSNPLGGAASIWLKAIDTDFAGTGLLKASIGGTADSATITAEACQIVGGCFSSGPLSGNPYSASFAVGPAGSDPYSMSLAIAVTGLRRGDTASGDFRVGVVPEPASLALLGLGLAGLAAARRRRTV